MTDLQILMCAGVCYLIAVFVSLRFNLKWLLLSTSVLWFVPMLLIENTFISLFSIVMIIATFVIVFFNKQESEF